VKLAYGDRESLDRSVGESLDQLSSSSSALDHHGQGGVDIADTGFSVNNSNVLTQPSCYA
jgi:hypothetical protein